MPFIFNFINYYYYDKASNTQLSLFVQIMLLTSHTELKSRIFWMRYCCLVSGLVCVEPDQPNTSGRPEAKRKGTPKERLSVIL
jgi:hypothetical protein